MIKHFFTSDLHLGHEGIFRHCNTTRCHMAVGNDQEIYTSEVDPNFRFSRASIENHDTMIIDSINTDVDAEGTVLWILGDFSLSRSTDVIRNYRNRINCKDVRLIWGNHDDGHAVVHSGAFAGMYESTFLLIDPTTGNFLTSDQWRVCCGSGFARKLLQKKSTHRIQLSHYAHATWWHSKKGSYHFYGHTHGTMEQWRRVHLPNAQCADVGWDIFNRAMPLQDLLTLYRRTKPNTPDN